MTGISLSSLGINSVTSALTPTLCPFTYSLGNIDFFPALSGPMGHFARLFASMPVTLLDCQLLGCRNCLPRVFIPECMWHPAHNGHWIDAFRMNEQPMAAWRISALTEYLLCDKHYVSGLQASFHYILTSLVSHSVLTTYMQLLLFPIFQTRKWGLGELSELHR